MSGANGQDLVADALVVQGPVDLIPKPAATVVKSVSKSEIAWMDTAMFDQSYRVARAIAMSGLTPQGFTGKNFEETAARCFRLVMMAWTWKMNPWQLADSCYIGPGGKFCVEGKVAIGVIGRHPAVDGHLDFEHSGSKDDRTVVVSAKLKGESEPREIRGSVRQWAKEQWSSKKNAFVPPNKMWYETGPGQDQKLCYVGAVWWCRRHCPEILLGVSIAEDIEAMGGPAGGPEDFVAPPPEKVREPRGHGSDDTIAGTVAALDAAGFDGIKEIQAIQDELGIAAGAISEAGIGRMVAAAQERIAAKGGTP